MSQTTTNNNDQVEKNNPDVEAPPPIKMPAAEITVETMNALLVVAALIMAATYQAVIQPPGGLWQETKDEKTAGKSILAHRHPIAFGMFLIFNTMGFYGSFLGIWLILGKFPMKWHMRVAFYPLAFTYSFCLGALTPHPNILNWIYMLIPVLMPFLFHITMELLRKTSEWSKKRGPWRK